MSGKSKGKGKGKVAPKKSSVKRPRSASVDTATHRIEPNGTHGADAPIDLDFDYDKTRLTPEDVAPWQRPDATDVYNSDVALLRFPEFPDELEMQITTCETTYMRGNSHPMVRWAGSAQIPVVKLYGTREGSSVCINVWNFAPYMILSAPVNAFPNASMEQDGEYVDMVADRMANAIDAFIRAEEKQKYGQRYGGGGGGNNQRHEDDAYREPYVPEPFDWEGAGMMGGLDKLDELMGQGDGDDADDGDFESAFLNSQKKKLAASKKRALISADNPMQSMPQFGEAPMDLSDMLPTESFQRNPKRKRYEDTSGPRVISVEPVRRKIAEHFQLDTTLLFKVNLRTPNMVSIIRNAIDNAGPHGFVFASGIRVAGPTFNSGMRFENRFMLDHGIVGTGWLCAKNAQRRIDSSTASSRCTIEYDVDESQVRGYELKEPRGVVLYATPSQIRVLSFDIECLGEKGRFPIAALDPVINIHAIGFTEGDPEHVIVDLAFVLGAVDEHKGSDGSSAATQTVCFRTERELLNAWAEFVMVFDPDVFTGYNIVNFDVRYLIERSIVVGATKMAQIGRQIGKDLRTRLEMRQSKNQGNREQFTTQCEGRVFIDMMLYVQNNMYKKLRSYRLNAVATEVLKDQKEDVDYAIIPKLHFGSRGDRKRLKDYCRKDAQLPHRLMIKLMALTSFFELTRVQRIQLDQQQNGGASFRVFAQLSHEMDAAGFVIPYRRDQAKMDYMGATVLEPKRGFYNQDPTVILDFGSLYPSVDIAQNGCITTHVQRDQVYLVLAHFLGAEAGNAYLTAVASDAPELVLKAMREEVIYTCPVGHCYVKAEYFKGVFPRMLETLLASRTEAKKFVPLATTPMARNVAVSRETAFKLSANSGYGFHGLASNGTYWYWIAESITAGGREQIEFTKQMIETHFSAANGYPGDASVIYGDSVTGDTPILMRYSSDGIPTLCTIDSIRGVDWSAHAAPWLQGGQVVKEHVSFPITGQDANELVEVWTDAGWSRLKRVIRHPVAKPIYRINTHTGSVCVTADHSLLKEDGTICKPADIAVASTLLMHRAYPPSLETCTDVTSVDEAFAMGFFFADGSCGSYKAVNGDMKNTWAINKQDLALLNLTRTKLNGLGEQERCGCTFKIIDTLASSGVYKLVASGTPLPLVQKYRRLFYDAGTRLKVVPPAIIHARRTVREAFWQGYYAGDGDHTGPGQRCDIKGQLGAAGMFWLLKTLGYSVSVHTRDDKTEIYRLTLTKGKMRRPPTAVKKIKLLSNGIPTTAGVATTMVYDLETENHHFSAGVGELVVHNTDSVMVLFGLKIADIKDPVCVSAAIERAINLGKEAGALCTNLLAKPNVLNFENICFPYLLINKKRYGGQVWTTSTKPSDTLKIKGVESVRRDNCRFMARTQERCLEYMLKRGDSALAMQFAQQQIKRLLMGQVDMYDLIISGQLGKYQADYKTPQAHAHVRELMEKRQPGSGPKIGDRVPYVLVDRGDKKAKRYECAEDPMHVMREKLPINTQYYLDKQLLKPITRIFKAVYPNVISLLTSGDHVRHLAKHIHLNPTRGLGQFFTTQQPCMGCGVAMPAGSSTIGASGKQPVPICSDCEPKRMQLYVATQRNFNAASLTYNRIWTNCQSCQGSFHQEVLCSAQDCVVFYKRFAARDALTDITKTLRSLEW